MCRYVKTFLIAMIVFTVTSYDVNRSDANETTLPVRSFRYLKAVGGKFAKETEILIEQSASHVVVASVTERGDRRLTITSRFDAQNVLQSATVTIQEGERRRSAKVSVEDGTARVVRDSTETNELRCPRGVIVTSAPDWTDSFMAVRRYDPNGDKTQQFPGLWVHPTQKPLELTIKLTHLGVDSVWRDGKTYELDRYLLVLRGGSQYIVWRNPAGQLVRLVPKRSGTGGIALVGWETATRGLKPTESSN